MKFHVICLLGAFLMHTDRGIATTKLTATFLMQTRIIKTITSENIKYISKSSFIFRGYHDDIIK